MATDFGSRQQRLSRTIGDMVQSSTDVLQEDRRLQEASTAAATAAASAAALLVAETVDPAKAQPSNDLLLRTSRPASVNPLDKDYVRFVDELLYAQCPAKSADFKNVESVIVFLERTSDESLKTKQIAPFNSNLPVLNISECCERNVKSSVMPPLTNKTVSTHGRSEVPSTPVAAVTSGSKAGRPTYSAILKPTGNGGSATQRESTDGPKKDVGTATTKKRSNTKSTLDSRATDKSGNAARKPSKRDRGRRSNRLKQTISFERTDMNEHKEEEAIPEPYASKRKGAPSNIDDNSKNLRPPVADVESPSDMEQRIVRNLYDLMQSSDDSVQSLPESETNTSTTNATKDRSGPTIVSEPPAVATATPSHTTSSREIFLHNFELLQRKCASNIAAQRSADEQQRELTTIYLRHQLSASSGGGRASGWDFWDREL